LISQPEDGGAPPLLRRGEESLDPVAPAAEVLDIRAV